MNEKTERFYTDEERARFARGPWDEEPDRIEWRHRGLPCLIVRNRMGALCGYVGLPPGHPMHGVSYNDAEVAPDEDGDTYPPAHGGLTYSGSCVEGGHICHVPEPGEPEDVWWLGFDCAQGGDVVPAHAPGSRLDAFYQELGLGSAGLFGPQVYRDVSYVRREVERLADSLLRGHEPLKLRGD
jgi:hypothetical protein